jgi:hypothetical protein
MVLGLFSGGVLVRCVANAPTSTSPGTSEPSALDFLLRLGAPLTPVLCGSAPLSGGNGSVIVSVERRTSSADPQRSTGGESATVRKGPTSVYKLNYGRNSCVRERERGRERENKTGPLPEQKRGSVQSKSCGLSASHVGKKVDVVASPFQLSRGSPQLRWCRKLLGKTALQWSSWHISYWQGFKCARVDLPRDSSSNQAGQG